MSEALPAYDGSGEARQAHGRFLARLVRRRGPSRLLEPRPTAAGIERHAMKFGAEQVAETAAEYGLSVAIVDAKEIKRVRRRR